jgi:hypothetical protein
MGFFESAFRFEFALEEHPHIVEGSELGDLGRRK